MTYDLLIYQLNGLRLQAFGASEEMAKAMLWWAVITNTRDADAERSQWAYLCEVRETE